MSFFKYIFALIFSSFYFIGCLYMLINTYKENRRNDYISSQAYYIEKNSPDSEYTDVYNTYQLGSDYRNQLDKNNEKISSRTSYNITEDRQAFNRILDYLSPLWTVLSIIGIAFINAVVTKITNRYI